MSKRITQLDGVRALAIGAVFVNHTFHVKLLWAGVDLFFILSGFLISGILIGSKSQSLKAYVGHFYERRARRILPSYGMLLIVVSIFFGLGWTHYWYRYLFLMNLAAVRPMPGTPGAMGVLWSLAVEEQFYMIWPIVVYFMSETAIAWTASGLIVAAPLLRWFCTPMFSTSFAIYNLTPFRMDLLAMGALLAVAWRKCRPVIERYGIYGPILSALSGAALMLLARNPKFYTYANTRESNVWLYECTLIACTGIILWALGGRHVGVLTWRPIVYLGRISYTVYLFHSAFIILVARHVSRSWEIAGLSATGVVAYAALSWNILESPALYWKPKSLVQQEAEADENSVTAAEL